MEIAPLSIAASARRNGHHAWMAGRLFELMGTSVATTPELAPKLMLGRHCYHYAWHAELFTSLLPTPAEVHPYAVVEAPTAVVETMFASLEQLTTTAERLHAIYGVAVPMMLDSVREHLDQCNPVTDAPTMRVLDLVVHDLSADEQQAREVMAPLVPFDTPQRSEHPVDPLSGRS
jgi:hypothetical protein